MRLKPKKNVHLHPQSATLRNHDLPFLTPQELTKHKGVFRTATHDRPRRTISPVSETRRAPALIPCLQGQVSMPALLESTASENHHLPAHSPVKASSLKKIADSHRLALDSFSYGYGHTVFGSDPTAHSYITECLVKQPELGVIWRPLGRLRKGFRRYLRFHAG
jgi:hypothetical protein